MKIVDAQRPQVDVEGESDAAGARRGVLEPPPVLRRAQHTDLRRGHDIDAQVPSQEGSKGPGELGVFDLQPRTGAVGDLDLRYAEIGRDEFVDAGDANLLIGRGGGAGNGGRQKPLAGGGLHARKGETEHRDERHEDIGTYAERAHQKACPRLT